MRSPRRAEPGEGGARARGLDYDGGEGSGWAARAGRVDVARTPEMDAGQTQDYRRVSVWPPQRPTGKA